MYGGKYLLGRSDLTVALNYSQMTENINYILINFNIW